MRSRVHFNRTAVIALTELLAAYRKTEFASQFRSTVPLIALVTSGSPVLVRVLEHCGFTQNADLHLEYQVATAGGRGTPSHTDLMVIEGPDAIAVEAKWTEPPSPSVRKWLGDEPSCNRKGVLDGWLSMIERRTGRKLPSSCVEPVSYQLVHRAASACSCGERPQLAYLEFLSAERKAPTHRFEDLDRLYAALGRPVSFPFRLIQIETHLTREFEQITALDRSMVADAVRRGLLAGTLFRFSGYRVVTLPAV